MLNGFWNVAPEDMTLVDGTLLRFAMRPTKGEAGVIDGVLDTARVKQNAINVETRENRIGLFIVETKNRKID